MNISYDLNDKTCFKQKQNINLIPKKLKVTASVWCHLIIDYLKIIAIAEMNSKEISIIISSKVNTPTSQMFFEKRFPLYNSQWKDMYTFWLKVIVNAYLRSLQYKILNNMLLVYHLSHTRLTACSFFKMEKQAISHLFYFCADIQHIWNHVQTI